MRGIRCCQVLGLNAAPRPPLLPKRPPIPPRPPPPAACVALPAAWVPAVAGTNLLMGRCGLLLPPPPPPLLLYMSPAWPAGWTHPDSTPTSSSSRSLERAASAAACVADVDAGVAAGCAALRPLPGVTPVAAIRSAARGGEISPSDSSLAAALWLLGEPALAEPERGASCRRLGDCLLLAASADEGRRSSTSLLSRLLLGRAPRRASSPVAIL